MRPMLQDIDIRNELRPGDIGMITHLHGAYYGAHHGFGVQFEAYVARGMHELYERYDAARDRVWICEHESRMVGSLVLMHRPEDAAQLRYFLVMPEYRGIGLGKKLMELFMRALSECGYRSAYLWTVNELPAAASLYRRCGFRLTEEKPSTSFGRPALEQRYDLLVGTG